MCVAISWFGLSQCQLRLERDGCMESRGDPTRSGHPWIRPKQEGVRKMVSIKEAATEFLAHKRIAVTGVSRKPQGHGSNAVYQRLRQRGYEVFAVNPNADEVEGDVSYHDLKSIPGRVEAVVIGTRPEIAEETMRECADLCIKHVWMHRGIPV
jgi:predicted CoA-binding protein